MSRLGKQPVQIPSGIEVSLTDGVLSVKGPKGTLVRKITGDVKVTIENNIVTFEKMKDTKESRALWGTYAAHFHNMIKGVTEGFTKILEVEGVGYKAEMQGNKIKLSVGFSHPVELALPEGVQAVVEKGVITITGIDKEVVGQFAADVRKTKKPEPYKGKGIHYKGEYIIRKQGKKGVA
ncbi:MAG: 50S ribosomal protein L6 [Candidatus Pacebacteria bacterium]|nr:50S ribosomal protein L6 [Candidatus Paceibacterota bacterium]MCF7857413.1 50S ribosomal protein L6 [Candidatus Paceibacterota bacterium]